MGHLGHLKAEYGALLSRLDAGPVGMPEPSDESARRAWAELLEIFFTPEEADIASRMPMKPAGLPRLSKRFGVPEEALEAKLDQMCDKGVVMDIVHARTGARKYLLAPPVVGFFEFSMMRASDMFDKKRVAAAMDAYMHRDRAFADEVFAYDTVIGRAVTHEEHITQDIDADVLDWERATALIESAQSLAVSMCYCRHKAEHLGKACDVPVESCLSLNAGAEFVSRRNFGRTIDHSEALDILVASRESGLVQIADNVQNRPNYVCNCCGCCCGQLSAINQYDLFAVNPSGFEPIINHDLCRGCSRCARACPIGAVSMAPVRVEGKTKNDMAPRIDAERCIGCGVCATACPKGHITMARRDQPPHVPLNSIERTVRQCIERGRLAELVFDEGSSRGAAFLGRVVSAIEHLPGPKQALASEHLRSRFVDFALDNIRDPTGG